MLSKNKIAINDLPTNLFSYFCFFNLYLVKYIKNKNLGNNPDFQLLKK